EARACAEGTARLPARAPAAGPVAHRQLHRGAGDGPARVRRGRRQLHGRPGPLRSAGWRLQRRCPRARTAGGDRALTSHPAARTSVRRRGRVAGPVRPARARRFRAPLHLRARPAAARSSPRMQMSFTESPRLSLSGLPQLPAQVQRPAYDPAATAMGIVHFGPGAFHRAHQAVYLDDLLAADPHWAISAVSLHSAGVRDALVPQDGLYTLMLLGEQPRMRVIGSIREVLCAPQQREAVLARLADPGVRLVTLTITEKGY